MKRGGGGGGGIFVEHALWFLVNTETAERTSNRQQSETARHDCTNKMATSSDVSISGLGISKVRFI